MGKGDKKTKRGKIVNGSYGARRLRKKKSVAYVAPKKEEAPAVEVVEETAKPKAKKPAAKKTTAKKATTKKADATATKKATTTRKKKEPAAKTEKPKTTAKKKTAAKKVEKPKDE